jgi:small-conductance mechanosensitive channel
MFSLFKSEIVSRALSITGIIVAVLILYFVVFSLIKKWARQKRGILPGLLQTYIYYPGLLLTLFVALSISLPVFEDYFNPKAATILFHILKVVTIASIGFLIIRITTVFRELAINHYKSENEADFSLRKAKTKFHLIQKVLNFLIILGTIAIILMTFKSIRSIGSSLLASAGVVGLVLGFAAQKSLSTLFAGIQIAISQPIRIDDVIMIDGSFGTVGEITLTYVVVNTWDGRRIIVPINYFLEKSFENWTRITSHVVGKVKIYTDYSIPVEKVREEFYRLLAESPLWDRRTSGFLITDANDKTIELRASMSAKNSDDAWDLECHIREKLITFISTNFPDALPKTRSMPLGTEAKLN